MSSKIGESELKAYYEGKSVLVTAGPTFEPIDPVRFIGNRSTGKMGICIADALASFHAEVTLVLGPSHLKPVHDSVKVIPVETADQMYRYCMEVFPETEIAVMAAAVADYTPVQVASEKIKKGDGNLQLELTRTKDILKTIGHQKAKGQIVVGFALETTDEVRNAQKKLKNKNADMIVLNSLRHAGAGFKHSTNQVTFVDKYNNILNFELKSKEDVALDIIEHIIKLSDANKL